MQAVKANDNPRARLARARQAGEVLALALHLTLDPDGHGKDLDRSMPCWRPG